MKLYNIALNNLRRRKAKMVLLVVGLAIAVSTVVTLVTISQAMNADIANKLDEYGANIVIVPKSEDLSLTYGGMSISGVSLDVQKLSDQDVQRIRTIRNRDNLKIIAPKLLNAAIVLKRNVLVVGVDFSQELQLKKWWKLTGKQPAERREAIIGAEARRNLQLEPGQSFEMNGQTFIIAAILEPTGSQDDGVIFISLREAQELFRKPNQVSLIEVAALCYDCPIEEIVRQTSEKLPGAKVMAIRQVIESKMETMHRFEQFSYGISAVVMLVAALIVMTNMTASVNERRREIGVFRAIGFRQTHIMHIILTEAFVISFAAGAVGYALGIAVSAALTPFFTMNVDSTISLHYSLLAFALVMSVAVGLLSSIYPAYQASRLDPTVALKAL